GPPQAGHPRPAGCGGGELAAPARLRGRRRTRGSRRRSRGGCVRRDRGTRRGRADVRAAAREPADRELRDRAGGRLVVSSPQPRIGVVQFPGSNDDRDAAWALSALDAEAVLVWHAERELPDLDAVVLPGGFSYGDYLRCGAIA